MEATLPNPAADLDHEGIAVVGEEEDIEEEDAVVGEEEDIETSRSSQLEEEEEEEDSTNHSHVVDVEPNLEEIDEEEVLKLLEVDKNYGLSSSEAARRLQIYGPNIRPLPEYEDTRFRRLVNRLLLCFDWDHVVPEEKIMARILLNPVSWTMLSAAVAAIAVSAVGGQMLYFYEGMAVLGLLLLNFVVCFVAKCRAQRAK